MNDIVLGVLAILIGAVFCFRGYFAMRIIIPIWGAFAGFVLGAGLVSTGGDEFLSTALSWIVGSRRRRRVRPDRLPVLRGRRLHRDDRDRLLSSAPR